MISSVSCRRILFVVLSVVALGWIVFASGTSPAQDFKLREFRSFVCSEGATFSVAIDPTQRFLATGGGDNRITLWDLQSSKQLRQWQPSKSSVIDLAFLPKSHLVASVSYPKHLTVYDSRADKQVWQTELLTKLWQSVG